MPNLNKVMLMGNLTRDPEVRYTPKGTAVTDIGLAVNRNYTLDDGERREETTFVDVTFWGRQAEVLGEYMKKGRPLYVEGRLNLDTWEDKQSGQQRSRLKVIGDGFQFLGGRDEGSGGGGGGGGQQSYGGRVLRRRKRTTFLFDPGKSSFSCDLTLLNRSPNPVESNYDGHTSIYPGGGMVLCGHLICKR